MKNRAARGGSERDNDKATTSSKFHFSKGKYGTIVLAWHGVLKAKANFPDICAQARKIFGADVELGNDNQRAQNMNPDIRTRVGLDSESESESGEENNANDGDHGNDNSEDRNTGSDIDYHNNYGVNNSGNSNDGINNDADDQNGDVDDQNGYYCDYKHDQNDAGPSRTEFEVVKSLECSTSNHDDAEKNDGGEETEEVDPGPSRNGGRRGTKAEGRNFSRK